VIDFRYHLISIVAVLLALSAGVVLGSGFVGGPVLEHVQDQAADLTARNGVLRAELDEKRDEIRAREEFLEAAEPYLVGGALGGEQVVMVELQGVDGETVEDMRSTIGEAGGSVASTIRLSDKLALSDDIERDQLALVVGSTSGDPEEVRVEAGRLLGTRLRDAAARGPTAAAAHQRLTELVQDLEEADFVSVDHEGAAKTVPEGSSFVVVGGSPDISGEAYAAMTAELAANAASDDVAVVVAETLSSEWDLIETIVGDAESRDATATAGGIDSVIGRVAAVFGLQRALQGEVGHYGAGPSADEPIPQPTPVP